MTEFIPEQLASAVRQIPGKGEGVVAASPMATGSPVFADTPLAWEQTLGEGGYRKSACENCGKFTGSWSVQIASLGAALGRDSGGVISSVKAIEGQLPRLPEPFRNCSCGRVFCSERCFQRCVEHPLICTALASGGALAALEREEYGSRLILGVKLLARAAALHQQGASIGQAEPAPNTHRERFTRSIHAFRGGAPLPDSMFAELLQPAYFDGYLRGAYTVACQLLASIGPEFAAHFLTEAYFDELIGMFMVNNLEVCVPHPLARAVSALRDSASEGRVAVAMLAGLMSACGGTFPPARGTGLYAQYAKMNHACDCNTRNMPTDAPGEWATAGVRVEAKRDVALDEELTTSYIAGDPLTMSAEDRGEALRQFLFDCRCRLCFTSS